ncbi:hypothetical protein N9Y92_00940, partial [Chlamydiales bacterium]|nr:hypothetical protein [Chlamydiales bacterium]
MSIRQILPYFPDDKHSSVEKSFNELLGREKEYVQAAFKNLSEGSRENLSRKIISSKEINWIQVIDEIQIEQISPELEQAATFEERRSKTLEKANNYKSSLINQGYSFAEVEGDGDCLFHACYCFSNPNQQSDKETALVIRAEMKEFIINNRVDLENSGHFEHGVEKAIETIGQSAFGESDRNHPGRGGLEHALLFAAMRGRPLIIMSHIEGIKDTYKNSCITHKALDGDPIHFFYDGEGHWDLVDPPGSSNK